jgi:hypothetical protein
MGPDAICQHETKPKSHSANLVVGHGHDAGPAPMSFHHAEHRSSVAGINSKFGVG